MFLLFADQECTHTGANNKNNLAKKEVPYIQILDMVIDIYFNEISIIVYVYIHNEVIKVTSYLRHYIFCPW